jgi:hypothetical protein
MRVKLKNIENKILPGFESESFMVIYFALGLDNQIMYGFFNDELMICNMLESSLIIVDEDKTDLIQRNELNYNRTFFLNKLLSEMFDFKNHYIEISDNGIWRKSKMSKFFNIYNYTLTEDYIKTALNEEYKLNLIEGYLMFANEYIIRKFEGGHYFERLDFYKEKTLQAGAQIKSEFELVKVDKSNYKKLMLDLISSTLYEVEIGEEKSQAYITDLFCLIDSIFIDEISELFTFETHYDNCIVIKYNGILYYLNKNWYG